MRAFFLVLFCVGGLACGSSESEPVTAVDAGDGGADAGTEDPTDAVFAADRVLAVNIELDPADWQALRYEGRGLASSSSCITTGYEYTYFEATVTVDGETIEHAGVRKKGFLGSLSVVRPSLKIHFGKFAPGQRYSGMKRMTLNNDRQDSSHTHQVMSYSLFRQAGVAAPRCNLARVTVNGEDLGVYSHVEAIKKPFLARAFGDDDGNLYEGQVADFTPELVALFERKTNEDALGPDGGVDRSDLDEVVEAVGADDQALLAALAEVVEADGLFTFWAMEVILGHWDGYSGDRNNYYLYRNPATERFHFIPWGTDGSFREDHAFLPDIPDSVYAWSAIAYRLYHYAETRALYHAKLGSLLDQLWNEDALLAEVDRIAGLVSPNSYALDRQRAFIASRKDVIMAELSGSGPPWPYPLTSAEPKCDEPLALSGTFAATWGSPDSYVAAPELSLAMGGEPLVFSQLYNAAGLVEDEQSGEAEVAAIRFYGVRASEDNLFVELRLIPSFVAPGQVPFHGFETFGVVVELDPDEESYELLGYIGDGAISFDAAGTGSGAEVAGSFDGGMTQ